MCPSRSSVIRLLTAPLAALMICNTSEQSRPSSRIRRRRVRQHAGGKGPCFDHAWEEVSARACRKRTTPPKKKYDNSNASYMCVPSGVRHGASMRCTTESTGVTFCGKHGGEWAATGARQESMRRRSKRSNNEAWECFWRRSKQRCGQADTALHR
jgi:hypothetical protein